MYVVNAILAFKSIHVYVNLLEKYVQNSNYVSSYNFKYHFRT